MIRLTELRTLTRRPITKLIREAVGAYYDLLTKRSFIYQPENAGVHDCGTSASEIPSYGVYLSIEEAKKEQEEKHRQQQALVVCQPLLGLNILAFGAVSVFTGVVAVMRFPAAVTLLELTAERLSAAWLNVLHGPPVSGKPLVAELPAVGGAMQAEDLHELDHHRSRMTRLIVAQLSGTALAVRWV